MTGTGPSGHAFFVATQRRVGFNIRDYQKIRVVIQRVARDRVQARIVWRGGETTTLSVPVHVERWTDLAEAAEVERIIRAESLRGVPAEEIA